ncbi:MAG: hypothetical protein QXI91_07290 [Candidatus Bathyarchaeia archaeon]
MRRKQFSAVLLIGCLLLGFLRGVRAVDFSMKVYRLSDGCFVIETDDSKIIIEELSPMHYRFTCIVDGNQTEFEMVVTNSSVILYFNGTEVLNYPRIEGDSQAASTMNMSIMAEIKQNYWWDKIYFVEGQYIKYPHPDRDYYGISPFSEQHLIGTKLYHWQFDQATSEALAGAGLDAMGAAIGFAITTLVAGDPVLGVLGAIAGAVICRFLVVYGGWVVLDEHDCMWWWISKAYGQWLADNAVWLVALWFICPHTAVDAAILGFLNCGYLRVGSLTFYDAVGAGNPSPQPNDDPTVGGFLIPIDKFGLLTHYVSLASIMLFIILSATIYIKHVKRKT